MLEGSVGHHESSLRVCMSIYLHPRECPTFGRDVILNNPRVRRGSIRAVESPLRRRAVEAPSVEVSPYDVFLPTSAGPYAAEKQAVLAECEARVRHLLQEACGYRQAGPYTSYSSASHLNLSPLSSLKLNEIAQRIPQKVLTSGRKVDEWRSLARGDGWYRGGAAGAGAPGGRGLPEIAQNILQHVC